MITRITNRPRVLSNREAEQEISLTPRKFGNIVNISEKNTNLSNRKGNQVPLYSYENENIEESHSNMKRTTILDGSHLTNSYLNYQNETDRGKNSRRNRDFVSKVQNINKMHDQISSLLRYVKGEDKSKESFLGDTLIKSNIRERPCQGKEKTVAPFLNKKIEESFTVPSILEESSNLNEDLMTRLEKFEKVYLNEKINIDNKRVEQREPREISQNTNNLMEGKINKYEGQSVSKAKNEKKEKLEQIIENSEFLQIPKFIVNKKEKENVGVGEKHNEEYVEKFTVEKSKINLEINYEKEISKVRERIENSERIRREMQEKYLHSDKTVSDRHYQKEDIQRLNYERQKVNRDLEKLYQNTLNSNLREVENSFFVEEDLNLSAYACKSRIEFVEKPQVRESQKEEVNRFVAERFAEQVKLDQKLRDSKYCFSHWKEANKWKLIQQRLQELGYAYTEKELIQQLEILPNESDPFMSEDSPVDILEEIAQNFVKSENFWQNRVCGCIEKQKLEQSGFDIKENDLSKRSYLEIEDLVCFVNMNTPNFFRNRDFVCVYKRLISLGKNKSGIDSASFNRTISFCV